VEYEWTMFRTSIVDAASKTYGLKVVMPVSRTHWWTPALKETVMLKKTFQSWLSQASAKEADSNRVAKRAAAGEAVDFRLASRMF